MLECTREISLALNGVMKQLGALSNLAFQGPFTDQQTFAKFPTSKRYFYRQSQGDPSTSKAP